MLLCELSEESALLQSHIGRLSRRLMTLKVGTEELNSTSL